MSIITSNQGTQRLTKLNATSGRCSKKVTGSMRMMGPIFAAICGVCRRWVDTTDPYLERSIVSIMACKG